MLFQPGNIVKARSRQWVVQSDSTDDWLILRPLGGADDEITKLIPQLEPDKVELAQFELPDLNQTGAFESANILYDALRFQLRSSSGPFRSFGSINFEPRSYQFVPLLMAMRQNVVRLLIADDVGVGKTIESGLIVRELIDRGEVQRFAVLCPPHLVEQWCDELEFHFNIKATALTANTSQSLEKIVPHGHTLTEYCPFLVVSLDYIKSDKHRDYFENMPLDLVLVDEAHTCVRVNNGKQQRFELLQKVTKDPNRHLLLLTATPHSGNEDAFFNLLSLLDKKFLALKENNSSNSPLRRELANYFVQRRRQDIKEWRVSSSERLTGFPVRKVSEISYKLDSLWYAFFEQVKDYCTDFMIQQEEHGELNMHSAAIYETIALFRCMSSSPAAAVQTLNNRLAKVQDRLSKLQGSELSELIEDTVTNNLSGNSHGNTSMQVQDNDDLMFQAEDMLEQELNGDESTELSDQEPSLLLSDSQELNRLVKLGNQLLGIEKDPKLKILASLVNDLLASGFQPVIFCRFISTAHYVADELKQVLCSKYAPESKTKAKRTTKKDASNEQADQANLDEPTSELQIGCVTGELVPEDRKARVEELMQSPKHVLVATDCLSEGINLQQGFTAVIHYDLAWNPTRHEQREGRVDRFGQTAPEVRCAMLYCENNVLDQLIVNVIIQKNKNIQKALGVSVPVPQQAEFIEKSILMSMLTGRDKGHQVSFLNTIEEEGTLSAPAPLGAYDSVPAKDRFIEQLNIKWEDSLKKANKQVTIFAQQKIHPEEIAPIWKNQQNLLGSFNDVLDFAKQGCASFGCKLEPVQKAQRKTLNQSISNFTWVNANTAHSDASNAGNNANVVSDQKPQANPLKFHFNLNDISDMSLKQSFKDEGFSNKSILDFSQMYRASPFISILSSSIVEHVMSNKHPYIKRCSISYSENVDKFTSIFLLRLRFQMKLTYNQQTRRHMMVEEIVPLMASGLTAPIWESSDRVRELITNTKGKGNFSSQAANRQLSKAYELLQNNSEQLNKLAQDRAEALRQEHDSIKRFTSDGHVTQVQPCMPIDIMGIYVLLPNLE